MSRRRLPLLALVFWPLLPDELVAQADTLPRPDTTVFEVEGLTVWARQPVITVGGASAVRVAVDSLRLPPAAATEEILRQIPALHVRTNSRGEAELSVRGSESRQAAVLLDGVPLTLGWDGRTDVSVLPATAIENVEFVRGLSTMLYGPNVLGGVLELSLGRASDVAQAARSTAAVGIDHLGGFGATATTSQPFGIGAGRARVRAGAGYRDTPGVPLARGVVEPLPAPSADLRLNTDVRNLDAFLAFRVEGDGGAWGSFSAVASRGERGIAAELGAEQPRFWRYPTLSRTIFVTSGGTGFRDTPLGQGDVEASVGVDLGRTEIRSYASRAYEEVVGSEDGDDRTLTLRVLGDHTLGARTDLRASATFADVSHDAVVDGDAASYRQRLFGLGAETIARLLENPDGAVQSLRLAFGGAYDRAATPETGGLEALGTLHDWGARVGLAALVNGGGTMIHAGMSRRGRFPSLRETYSEALNRFVPNPDLTAEHLVAVEAGVTTRLGRGELQLVGFRNDLSDAIRRITLPDGRRMRVNSDELTSSGVEVLFSQSAGSLGFGGDLTLQTVRLRDAAAESSTEPENLPERVGRVWARYVLPGDAWVLGEGEYTGSQFCQDPDTGRDVELDAGTLLDASIGKVWRAAGGGRGIDASISGSNLADARLYDQCGLPRPGRLIRIQVRVF